MADDSEEPSKREIPAPPPDAAGPAPGSPKDSAEEEVAQLSRGMSGRDLENEQKEHDHDRGERFRDNFERLAIWSMYVMFGILSLFGIVWVWHMIAPDKCTVFIQIGSAKIWLCRWLTCDQVTIVQDIVTGGLIAGLLAEHFRHRMKR
jgi:hypothetical protein